jgi:pimeloyl-ACP methyl ester carboxylesterase
MHDMDQRPTPSTDGISVFVTAPDGLRLHVREYGDRTGMPVVCLPGLSRTAADFEPLAAALVSDPQRPRWVLALDYRGRGLSDYDRNPGYYTLTVELEDLLAVLEARAVRPAVFIGTSRGGLLTMLLAAVRPNAIAGAILNDVGPVIESKGLMRIKGYVGKLPLPRTYDEGAEILRRLFDAQFTALDDDGWRAFARRTWREENGRLVPSYDANLAQALAAVDPEHPLPVMWAQFDALARVPMMVIRGANSDLLSAETVVQMRARRSNLEVVEVPDEGHAPLLADALTIGRIAGFVALCEKKAVRDLPRTAPEEPPSES